MANKIQIRRGLKANLPTLDVGEPALCTDTKEVFVGNTGGNVALINKEVMDSHLENYVLQIPYGAAGGSANTYTVTLNPALKTYTEGIAIAVKINVSNTGAATVNINGLGAKSIRDPRGNTLPAGKLTAGSIYTLRYNGTNFILQGEGVSGNATASDLLSGKTASTDAGDITGTMPNRAGDNVNLASSVSGTTLKLRAPNGYYDGIDDTVTINDTDFVASNIKSGVNLFGIVGTMPIKPDDYRGSPGGQYLTYGDMTTGGYFGRYTGIGTGAQISTLATITNGSTQFYPSTSIEWVKFGFEGKIIFIAQKPIRKSVSWDDLNAKGCVYGTKIFTIDGITYKCRLVRIRNYDPGTTDGMELLLLRKLQGTWDSLSATDLHMISGLPPTGARCLAQETQEGYSANCYGFDNSVGTQSKNDRQDWFGWRPVLEVV